MVLLRIHFLELIKKTLYITGNAYKELFENPVKEKVMER